jgi:hypothetical protein
MGAPQLLWIVLNALGLGVALATHGQPRKPGSFGYTLIAFGIEMMLLVWGGFFGRWIV